MDVQELLNRVAGKLALANPDSEATPLEAACWFIAVQEARDVLESFRAKDLAHVILDGLALGGPYRTEADLQVWIESVEDGYDHDDDAWEWLDAAFNDHFGLPS